MADNTDKRIERAGQLALLVAGLAVWVLTVAVALLLRSL